MNRVCFMAFGLCLTGCITPSIPIPPPDPTEMTIHLTGTNAATTAVLTYPPTDNYKHGVAYVFDRTLGHGSIDLVNPDGSVGPTTAIPAHVGDQIVFTIENGSQSVSTCVVLREGTQDPTIYCP
jgi:hypothetical protein